MGREALHTQEDPLILQQLQHSSRVLATLPALPNPAIPILDLAPVLHLAPAPAPPAPILPIQPVIPIVDNPLPLQAVQLPLACQPIIEGSAITVYHDFGSMDIECPKCDALHWMAEHLTKSSNRNPLFGGCCLSGKIKLPKLENLPR